MRRLALTLAVLAVALIVPASASAVTIETHSYDAVGQLSYDLHPTGSHTFRWTHLHYQLHAPCEVGGAGCSFSLFGKSSSSYASQCPHQLTGSGSISEPTRPFFGAGVQDGRSLSQGGGEFRVPGNYVILVRVPICWYVEIGYSHDRTFTLTARTVISY